MTRDPLDQALATLAARADTHRPGDRVPAVRRRARRAAAVRAGAAGGAVALVAVAVLLGAGEGTPFAREGTPADPAPRPYLKVSVTEAPELEARIPPDPRGEHRLVVMVTVEGLVPRREPAPDEEPPEGLFNVHHDFDWGVYGRRGPRESSYTCTAGAPLMPVREEYPVTAIYERPGTYTVTYRFEACDPVAPIERELTVTVE
jgi:hypothetical protein